MLALRNSISNILTKVMVAPFSFAFSIIIARILGPDNRGVFGFSITLISIISILISFGLGIGMYYQVSSKKYNTCDVIFSAAFVGFIMGQFIGFLIIGIYLCEVFPLLNVLSLVQVILIGSIAIFSSLRSYLNRFLIADGFFQEDNKIKLITGFFQFLLLILFFCSFEMKITSVIILYSFVSLIGCFLVASSLSNYIGEIRWNINRDFLRDSFNFGIRSWVGDLAQVGSLRIDQILLGMMVNTYELGIYIVAVSLSELIWVVPDAINSVLLNKMSSPDLELKYKIVLAGRICKSLLIFGTISSIFLLLLCIFLIIPFGYGIEYITSIDALIYLIPGAILVIYFKVITKLLTGTGNVIDTTKTVVIGSIFGAFLYIILIPMHGAMGAAIASSSCYLIVSISSIYFLKTRFPEFYINFLKWNIDDYNWMRKYLNATFAFSILRNWK